MAKAKSTRRQAESSPSDHLPVLDRALTEQRIVAVRATISRANAVIACAIAAAGTGMDYADEIGDSLQVALDMLRHVCGNDLDQVVLYAPAEVREVSHG